MSSNVKDILDRINNLYSSSVNGSLIESAMELQKEIDRSKGIGYEDKRLLTIKNPEGLNTNGNPIQGWDIEYQGRDLSLDVDNYRWNITNLNSGVKGYYIIQREFIKDTEWVYVLWGKTPLKEIRESIDKKRLRDKDMVKRDMIIAIMKSK